MVFGNGLTLIDMVRQIIIPDSSRITVQLPDSMIGKTVEVLAFEVAADEPTAVASKEERLRRIEKLTARSRVDLSDFRFDRNEANNYDE
jgi:hypothetical protein